MAIPGQSQRVRGTHFFESSCCQSIQRDSVVPSRPALCGPSGTTRGQAFICRAAFRETPTQSTTVQCTVVPSQVAPCAAAGHGNPSRSGTAQCTVLRRQVARRSASGMAGAKVSSSSRFLRESNAKHYCTMCSSAITGSSVRIRQPRESHPKQYCGGRSPAGRRPGWPGRRSRHRAAF